MFVYLHTEKVNVKCQVITSENTRNIETSIRDVQAEPKCQKAHRVAPLKDYDILMSQHHHNSGANQHSWIHLCKPESIF